MHGLMQVYHNRQTHWQIGDNTNLFDWTYVTNVAKAHLIAADKLSEVLNSKAEESIAEAMEQPLAMVELTTGSRRIPTSKARPLGPVVVPPSNADDLEKSFTSKESMEPRPIVRSRFDPLSQDSISSEKDDSSASATPLALRVDGQVFFITNGEPTYFWDFMRAVWREIGDPLDRSNIILPKKVGLLLATLSEGFGWLVGKEPTFTRFRVTFSCATRWHNIEKARRVLGYEPDVGVLEGVKRMVEVR
jgi:sterol-4alpha-carboxylate 3-dehydrogenase (decarboxylating)